MAEFSAVIKSARKVGLGLTLGKEHNFSSLVTPVPESVVFHFRSITDDAVRARHFKAVSEGLSDSEVVFKPNKDKTRLIVRAKKHLDAKGNVSSYNGLVRVVREVLKPGRWYPGKDRLGKSDF